MWCPPLFGDLIGGVWMFPFFWLLVIVLFLVLLSRGFGARGQVRGPSCGLPSRRDGQGTPGDIARRRYARGQITGEELDEILETLKQ
jgi:uncharacterized membrane protein